MHINLIVFAVNIESKYTTNVLLILARSKNIVLQMTARLLYNNKKIEIIK